MKNKDQFIAAMIDEGFDPKPYMRSKSALYDAALQFARVKGDSAPASGAYSTISVNVGRGVLVETSSKQWWFEGKTPREAAAAVQSLLGDPRAAQVVKTYYIRLDVLEDGQIALRMDERKSAAARAGALLRRLRNHDKAIDDYDRLGADLLEHLFAVDTDGFMPQTKLTPGQARAMAEQLPERLARELQHLARPTKGGRQKYGPSAARVQHGLTDEQLVKFAQDCDAETVEANNPRKVRRELARAHGIPENYGGRAKDEALRRLVRRGRELAATR